MTCVHKTSALKKNVVPKTTCVQLIVSLIKNN